MAIDVIRYDSKRSKEALHYGVYFLQVGKLSKDDPAKLIYPLNIKIINQATYNCQMSALGGASELLVRHSVEELATIISKITNNYLFTNCLLFDVYKNQGNKLIEAIRLSDEENEIIFETPYENTTGSSMVMIYVRVKPLPDEEDDDDEWY